MIISCTFECQLVQLSTFSCRWWLKNKKSGRGQLGGLVLYFIKPTFFYWFIKLGIKYFTFITFLIKSHFAKPRAVTFFSYFAKVKTNKAK